MKRNCNECQEEYDAEPRYLNRGQGLFCSRLCSQAYHGRLRVVKHEPNVSCAWCGLDFYKQPSKLKNSKSGLFYCSKGHQDLGAENEMHLSGPPRNPNSRKNSRCLRCNKKYSGEREVCLSCYKKCILEEWLAGNNSVTLNRSRSTGLPTDTKKFVKEYLLKARGDKCEVCGWDEKAPDGRSIIQMDHINGNCFDNRPENLKLLCPNHHAMTTTYGSLNKGSGRAHRRKPKSPA